MIKALIENEALMSMFSWIGILLVAGCIFAFLYCAFTMIRDVILELCWQHKYKHRFDKPPTAACYCKDCKWHIEKGDSKHKCTNVVWADKYTPDNGFCYEAEPRKKDVDDGSTID